MKTKFSKILSSLLILSLLISMFSVFSFAENAEENTDEGAGSYTLFLHRTFNEGWAPSNGMTLSTGGNSVFVDYEEGITNEYNYFTRFESTGVSKAASLTFKFGAEAIIPSGEADDVMLEFSLKTDDVAQLGSIVTFATQLYTGASKAEVQTLISLDKDQNIVAFPDSDKPIIIGKLENKWVNIAFSLNFKKVGAVSGKLYYGTGEGYQENEDFDIALGNVQGGGISNFSFGLPVLSSRSNTNAAESKGMTFCLDNLKIYSGTNKIQDIKDDDYGTKLDRNAAKTVDIQKNAKDKSKAQLIEEALAMKVGVDHALIRSVKYPLLNNKNQDTYKGTYGAPQVDAEGNVLVPLELILDYIGFPYYLHADKKSFDITTGSNVTNITLDRDSAVVDGVRMELVTAPRYVIDGENSYICLALADVGTLFPGWLTVYDNMGFILIYEDKTPENQDDNTPILTRENDLQTMIDIMKKFVFDKVEVEDATESYFVNGEKVYNDAKANTKNFSHPYIIANADTFATVKAAYALTEGQAGYDANLSAYIKAVLAEAESYYITNAQVSGASYIGIKADKKPVNPYSDGKNPNSSDKSILEDTMDGYDSKTGRLDQVEEYAKILPVIAFAYQITGNENYAKFAYDWTVELTKWEHWGPGYFENCANATASVAISYDWLYNAYKGLGKDTDAVAKAIYDLGVHDGYVASSGGVCEHPRSLGDLSGYTTMANDMNAAGVYGMITGALAILDYVDENATQLSETIYLIGNNMDMLATYGLDIYAPDGSYVESAKQWEIGTSSFFRMVMTLISTTGSDYGFMDTWGIDKTCYFGINIESSDGFAWNYNDANGDGVTSSDVLESLNTDMFYFVGTYYGDENLIAVRQKQIAAGKKATLFDVISYPMGKTFKNPELSLDYHMAGIEAYVSRSDWEKGAMYVGLMGGDNSGNNAQIDSGNFVYHNKGIVWFMDLGGEDPTNKNYADENNRYKLYRACAEGQNVVYIFDNEDIVYGQQEVGGGKLIKTFENEHGSYAILDNTEAYSSAIVSQAQRGLLVTNDRKSVVIQDEISFVRAQKVYWVAHTAQTIYIDPTTQRTAYLSANGPDGKPYTLRVSIITPSTDLKFSTLKSEIIDKTLENTTDAGSVYKRDKINRLAIALGGEGEYSGVGSLMVSVVFEIVEGRSDTTPVGYEWGLMNTWEPKTYDAKDSDGAAEAVKRAPATAQQIKTETPKLVTALKKSNAFKERVKSIYDMLTLIQYTLNKYPAENLDSSYASHYGDYLDCYDKYEGFYNYVNDSVKVVDSLSTKLTGIVVEEAEDAENDEDGGETEEE